MDEVLFGKVLAHVLVNGVGYMLLVHQGDGLRPCQGGAFTLGIEGGFLPGRKAIETFLRFTGRTGRSGVKIESVGTPVNL